MDYPSVVFICVDNSIRGSSMETVSKLRYHVSDCLLDILV